MLLRHKLPESLPSVTCPELTMSRNTFVAVTIFLAIGLEHNFIAPLQHKLRESLSSVICPELTMSQNAFVAVSFLRTRTNFYFSQRNEHVLQWFCCSYHREK